MVMKKFLVSLGCVIACGSANLMATDSDSAKTASADLSASASIRTDSFARINTDLLASADLSAPEPSVVESQPSIDSEETIEKQDLHEVGCVKRFLCAYKWPIVCVGTAVLSIVAYTCRNNICGAAIGVANVVKWLFTVEFL
jgi:hypothetical protein